MQRIKAETISESMNHESWRIWSHNKSQAGKEKKKKTPLDMWLKSLGTSFQGKEDTLKEN